ncbi:stage III sporulation protein AB [Jeotgalibacillus haloalkalitolerans]|uniref:Stage III sporulation protein AB n=1 Tax=Jeotgalibacillus haloalkalitolerans TaxID=3104292 RepID=A0ABU5KLJ0_9BACL|nr:stage III sporulation protein AB [Jeotgalibacillus sp. HH7-29]MDZ5712134.1 stage III sporulation protein AB [Jeotgalibacillus sp. HH7-29]
MTYSFGAVCIILSFTLEGMRRASLLIKRRKLLLECLRFSKWMEREVADRRTSITEMISVQCQTSSLLTDFFKQVEAELATSPFHHAWKQTVINHQSFNCLKKEDLNWLVKISDAFRNIHIDSVEKELSFIIAGIQTRYEEALEFESKFVKIYRTIGFMTGLIAVLLLI